MENGNGRDRYKFRANTPYVKYHGQVQVIKYWLFALFTDCLLHDEEVQPILVGGIIDRKGSRKAKVVGLTAANSLVSLTFFTLILGNRLSLCRQILLSLEGRGQKIF